MEMNQILSAIRTLAQSQGYYGRLYNSLMYAREKSPEQYDAVVAQLEGQKFGDMLDMVMYFEC